MGPRKVAIAAVGILATMLPWSATANAQEVPTISAEGFEHRFVARELPNRVSWGYMVSALADLTGNGKPDIITKVWRPWRGNANDGREHVDLLINRIGD